MERFLEKGKITGELPYIQYRHLEQELLIDEEYSSIKQSMEYLKSLDQKLENAKPEEIELVLEEIEKAEGDLEKIQNAFYEDYINPDQKTEEYLNEIGIDGEVQESRKKYANTMIAEREESDEIGSITLASLRETIAKRQKEGVEK